MDSNKQREDGDLIQYEKHTIVEKHNFEDGEEMSMISDQQLPPDTSTLEPLKLQKDEQYDAKEIYTTDEPQSAPNLEQFDDNTTNNQRTGSGSSSSHGFDRVDDIEQHANAREHISASDISLKYATQEDAVAFNATEEQQLPILRPETVGLLQDLDARQSQKIVENFAMSKEDENVAFSKNEEKHERHSNARQHGGQSEIDREENARKQEKSNKEKHERHSNARQHGGQAEIDREENTRKEEKSNKKQEDEATTPSNASTSIEHTSSSSSTHKVERKASLIIDEEPEQIRAHVSRSLRSTILWEDASHSGVVFLVGLGILVCFAVMPMAEIILYALFLAMMASLSFVGFKYLASKFTNDSFEHPLATVIRSEVTIDPEWAHRFLDYVLKFVNAQLVNLKKIVLAENVQRTGKAAAICYVLTYFSAYFTGMSWIILGWVAMFTLPKVYYMYQGPIDKNIELVHGKVQQAEDALVKKVPKLKPLLEMRRGSKKQA